MKRLKYIDTAKGYLILLVVLAHVLIVLNPHYAKLYYTAPQAFIYTFHMPAFSPFSSFTAFCLMLKSGKNAVQRSSLSADFRR